ncbi:MAG: hypothetical protein AVDCRST_MAG93-45, partial [uncultured Chloroflexia bacterium]
QQAEYLMFDWSDLTLLWPWKLQLGCLVLFLAGGLLVFLLIRDHHVVRYPRIADNGPASAKPCSYRAN